MSGMLTARELRLMWTPRQLQQQLQITRAEDAAQLSALATELQEARRAHTADVERCEVGNEAKLREIAALKADRDRLEEAAEREAARRAATVKAAFDLSPASSAGDVSFGIDKPHANIHTAAVSHEATTSSEVDVRPRDADVSGSEAAHSVAHAKNIAGPDSPSDDDDGYL
eukprot:NODE_19160_length_857_cov_2.431507.p2 GENE.NODE_19160_length_857_cov_2.431507~~NODE_19160_length_857_cov_2.431507.p2  ORF type:complete len:171 (+),score=56.92 NODE_19160_length_857_cov_2.431507:51-563(+)